VSGAVQIAIVAVLVIGALAYLVRHARRTFEGRGGCGGCAAADAPSTRDGRSGSRLPSFEGRGIDATPSSPRER
jgi:hypothetical protein